MTRDTPGIVDFLGQDYCYKSVATQPHDAELALIHPAEDLTRHLCMRGGDSTFPHSEVLETCVDVLTAPVSDHQSVLASINH
jgi:hypothetical protein